jgi:hypothetical protein
MSRREVLAFFRRYRAAFDRLDGDAVAALWHAPRAIADTAQPDWTLKRRDGSGLQRFATGYQLVRGEDGVRVLTAAAYQENIGKMKKGAHAAQ